MSMAYSIAWRSFCIGVAATVCGILPQAWGTGETPSREIGVEGSVGQVFLRPAKGEYRASTKLLSQVPGGTFVKTVGGPAVLFLPNGSSVFLEDRTEVLVNVFAGGDGIRQIAGSAAYIVQSTGRYLYVRTPDTLATAVGTRFEVEIMGNNINLDVNEGEVVSVVLDREYSPWDPNGPEIQPIVSTPINPLRVNFYPDGTWGFGTVTPGQRTGVEYHEYRHGTTVETGQRAEYRPAPPQSPPEQQVVTIKPIPTPAGYRQRLAQLRDQFLAQDKQLRERYLVHRDFGERTAHDLDLNWIRYLADRGNLQMEYGQQEDPLDCAVFRRNYERYGRPAAEKLRADPQRKAAADMIIPGGLDAWDRFCRHVCDDGVIDAAERQHIAEVGKFFGFGAAPAPSP